MIYLNRSWCKNCGICIEICKKNIFCFDSRLQLEVIDSYKCNGCKMCEVHCPEFAIKILG